MQAVSHCRNAGAAGALGSGDIRLPHRKPRHPPEHHGHQSGVAGNLAQAESGCESNPAPEPASAGMDRTGLVVELNKPLGFLPNFFGVSEETRELLDLLNLIRETLDGPDPQSIGTFILSMTRIASDVLGLYLLAKYSGLFPTMIPRESCRIASRAAF